MSITGLSVPAVVDSTMSPPPLVMSAPVASFIWTVIVAVLIPSGRRCVGEAVMSAVASRFPSRTVPLAPTARIPGLGSPKTPERFSVVPLTSAVQLTPSYWMIVPPSPTAMTSVEEVPHTERRNEIVGVVMFVQLRPS